MENKETRKCEMKWMSISFAGQKKTSNSHGNTIATIQPKTPMFYDFGDSTSQAE